MNYGMPNNTAAHMIPKSFCKSVSFALFGSSFVIIIFYFILQKYLVQQNSQSKLINTTT